MNIEFIGNGKITTTTPQHINEALEDFGEELNVKVVRPVFFLTIQDNSTPIYANSRNIFQSNT